MKAGSRLLVFGLPAAACAAWTVLAGKDVNWDLLNYHYYLPFELVAGRLGQDFFAASAQSYLNPLGYLPFYLLLSAGVHSVLASIALALAHSVALALLWLIAWRLFAHLPQRSRAGMSTLATALGAASGVFWATVGTSFLDPLLLPLMLGGLLLLQERRGFALAGLLFGAAAALKYSNALFALAALPLAFLAGRRAALAYMGGGALAVAALAGPWLFLMAREFGNPVFPLFNAWFASPHAPAFNQLMARFTPADLGAALGFPFRMALLDRSLYTETFAPDLRPAALAAAAIALAFLARRRATAAALRAEDGRLLAFFGAGWALWLASSANARYGMILLLLAGVCLARFAERLLPLRAARVALGALLAVQLATVVVASPARWFVAEPWSRHWLPYAAPQRALQAPALYLTLETLPMAALAPFVHPASSFVNFRGQHSLAPDAPRLAALLERHRGRERALGRSLALVDGAPQPLVVRDYNASLERLGLRLDPADCFTVEWRRDDGDDALSQLANALSRTPPSSEPLSAVSCGLRPAPRDPLREAAERRASAIFARIERDCAALLRGQTAETEAFGAGWARSYSGLDARLETMGETLVLHRYRVGAIVQLGRPADWERSEPPPCGGR